MTAALVERFALALLAATQRHRTRQRLRRLIAADRKQRTVWIHG